MKVYPSSQFELKEGGDVLNPFPDLPFQFLKLLHESDCIGPSSGWVPLYFYGKDEEKNEIKGFSFSYLKNHSYGEYIFDWGWADFYGKMGVPYYPKLVHCLPFTPVNCPKVFGNGGEVKEALLKRAYSFYKENSGISGHHYLFTNSFENEFLLGLGYKIQETHQYHWENIWESFDDFLGSLKKEKRKKIKRERKEVKKYELEFIKKEGKDLDSHEIMEVYQLYLATISKKKSIPYLNENFFKSFPNQLGRGTLIILAKDKNNQTKAMSLFGKTKTHLFGRYWGVDPSVEDQYPFLHFELCYYQGMDYCFEQEIQVFEAGAQGEQKLLRGFRPIKITSAHHLRNPALFKIIGNHIDERNEELEKRLRDLSQFLPFKNNETN